MKKLVAKIYLIAVAAAAAVAVTIAMYVAAEDALVGPIVFWGTLGMIAGFVWAVTTIWED